MSKAAAIHQEVAVARAKTARPSGGPVFGFRPGRQLEGRYVLGQCIGAGWEGEVYHLTERRTQIERVVKFYYPHRYPNQKRWVRLAQKHHKLRDCPIVLQYHHHGQMTWRGRDVHYMVSELAEGEVLYDVLMRQPRKRFTAFEAMHITHTIAKGMAQIHARREYHGDIHSYNVLVRRQGIRFKVKLLDLYLNPKSSDRRTRGDVCDIAMLLYELIGGPATYKTAPRIVKDIVCGRRRDVIARKFSNAGAICDYLVTAEWPEDD